MFAAWCPRHESVHLFGMSDVAHLTHLDPGVIAVELTCGDEKIVILTGSRVDRSGSP